MGSPSFSWAAQRIRLVEAAPALNDDLVIPVIAAKNCAEIGAHSTNEERGRSHEGCQDRYSARAVSRISHRRLSLLSLRVKFIDTLLRLFRRDTCTRGYGLYQIGLVRFV